MTAPLPLLRDLNDYESMLATSTCNVGISFTLPRCRRHNDQECESNLRQAWTRTVQERQQLQVKLVAKDGDMGPLGQRYGLAEIPFDTHPSLFRVVQTHVPAPNSNNSLLTKLQHIGTTALDISKGSYTVVCFLCENADPDDNSSTTQSVQVIISLCHALSDGPGALRVARSFLEHLGHVLDEQQSSAATSSTSGSTTTPQTLIDLQAQLLGSDYAKQEPEQTDIFVGQKDFTEALGQQQQHHGTLLLPVEAMQKIPTDAGFGTEPSVIDCIHFSLTAHETTMLRTKCREHNTTVQGALVAAALKARLQLFGHLSPDNDASRVLAAVQIPVNTRSLAHVDDDSCLCGSAGVWHAVAIPLPKTTTTWWDIARESTQRVRAALHDNNAQHVREWLRRLFHAAATLPPYSIMVSSIGVAPIESSYGQQNSVQVNQLLFFGASLRTQQPSQAVGSMMHAVTFRDEFHCLFNFTSPGISKAFAERTAQEIKDTLLLLATL